MTDIEARILSILANTQRALSPFDLARRIFRGNASQDEALKRIHMVYGAIEKLRVEQSIEPVSSQDGHANYIIKE